MALDRVTLAGLAAVFAILAVVNSAWWLAGVAAVAGWLWFDRWARRGHVVAIPGPRGRPLPLADAAHARNPGYVIGDFLAAAGNAQAGALLIAPAHIAGIVRQCARECRRVGQPEPPMVLAMTALEPYCAGCGLPYSPALLRQPWRDATARGGTEIASGALPTMEGACPKCGNPLILLVFDP